MSKAFPPNELDSLSIKKMIFHRLSKEEDSPSYLDEVVLQESQYDFFENVIRIAASKSSQFNFLEEEGESILLQIDMLENPTEHFFSNARQMTRLFKQLHPSHHCDGVLLFALVEVGEMGHKMLFIAKMDELEVLQYGIESTEEGQQKAILENIQNTIIENESAILKSALIDIDAHYEWNVLAQDRQKSGPGIADFFKLFLHVQEKEINAILSTKVVAEVQKWAEKNKEEVLQEAENVADYKERAVSYLRTAEEFDSHQLMDIVIPPEEDNLERKQELTQSLFEHLDSKDLAQLNFVPEPENIKSSVTKSSIKTKEGVQITWDGDQEAHGIEIRRVDGKMQIIISTEDYTFK